MREIRIYNGQSGRKIMPHSEVCMHLHISDTPMYFRFEIRGYLNNGIDGIAMVQLFDPNNPTQHFSSPILASEAGIYRDDNGFYYYAEQEPDLTAFFEID